MIDGLLHRRRLMMAKPSGGILPSEYQRVEWIQALRNGYIDTNVLGDFNNYYTYIKLQRTSIIGRNEAIMGVRDNAQYFLHAQVGFDGIVGRVNSKAAVFSPADLDVHEYVLSKSKFVCDGISKDIPGVSYTGSFPYSMHLFSANLNNSPSLLSGGMYKLYSFKVYSLANDELLRDFIPCYRKIDGVIGVYELLGNICPATNTPFFAGLNGRFTKGGNIK